MLTCDLNYIACQQIMLHVDIIKSHVNINKSYVYIIMLHFNNSSCT